MSIESVQIATNKYAPSGSSAINLYNTSLAENLTLGQLVIAVSLRTAAMYESQSVAKMNATAIDSTTLTTASTWLRSIANGTADSDWSTIKTFCIDTLGVESNALPADLNSYDKRMQAINAMKAKMDILTQSQQQAMIDIQTLVNRRDVAYSTSSNITRAFGTSMSGNADNI